MYQLIANIALMYLVVVSAAIWYRRASAAKAKSSKNGVK